MTSGTVRVTLRLPAVIVELEGEFDVSNVREVLEDVIPNVPNEARGVVMDLTSVRYLDSAGIRMLFHLAESLSTCRQRMVLCLGEQSSIRTLVKITNLDLVAPAFGTIEEALDALSPAG